MLSRIEAFARKSLTAFIFGLELRRPVLDGPRSGDDQLEKRITGYENAIRDFAYAADRLRKRRDAGNPIPPCHSRRVALRVGAFAAARHLCLEHPIAFERF